MYAKVKEKPLTEKKQNFIEQAVRICNYTTSIGSCRLFGITSWQDNNFFIARPSVAHPVK